MPLESSYRIIKFDEGGSDTNNQFHKGLNVTVRYGSRYAHDLKVGTDLLLENLQGEKLGEGVACGVLCLPLSHIPPGVLSLEHDPSCRTHGGLRKCLENVYPKEEISDYTVVTVVFFIIP